MRYFLAIFAALLPALSFAQVDLRALERSLDGHEIVQSAFRQTLDDPTLGNILRHNLENAAKTKIGLRHPAKVAVLGMALQETTRQLLISAILAERRTESRSLSNGIAEKPQFFDLLVLGTGPTAAQTIVTFEQEFPGLRALVVEQGNTIGGTFDSLIFYLNTSNKPSRDSEVPRYHSENENEIIGGILQVPEIEPGAYPVARSMSDVLKVNLGLAKTPMLFEHSVVKIEKRELAADGKDWPGQRRLTLQDAQGKLKTIFTNAIIDGGGLGIPNVPTRDPEKETFFRREYDKFANDPTYDGRITNFQSISKRIDVSEHPMEAFADKTILVVGDSVASKDMILWLYRYGPKESYKSSFGQEGRCKKIIWIGHEENSIDDFLKNNRLFYSRIATGLKNGMLEMGGKGRASDVRYIYNLDGTIKEVIVETEGATPDAPKKVFHGDLAFFGIGYKNDIDKLYEPLVSPELLVDASGKRVRLLDSEAVEVITAPAEKVINAEGGATGKEVAIAKKIVGEEIYVLGARAGLIAAGEIPNSPAGSPLMKDNLPRVREAVKKIFANVKPNFTDEFILPMRSPMNLMPIAASAQKKLAKAMQKSIQTLKRLHPNAPIRLNQAGQDLIYLKARIENTLSNLHVSRVNKAPIVVNLSAEGSGSYKIKTKTRFKLLDHLLTYELSKDPEFTEVLAAAVHYRDLELTLEVNSEGKWRITSTTFRERKCGSFLQE